MGAPTNLGGEQEQETKKEKGNGLQYDQSYHYEAPACGFDPKLNVIFGRRIGPW